MVKDIVVGQKIYFRKRGCNWLKFREFRVTAIGEKCMLGYTQALPEVEVRLSPSEHEWRLTKPE